MVELSIIIPAYNEEDNVTLLYQELKKVLDKQNTSYEMIFVDDGSTDQTFSRLQKLHHLDRKIKVIRFRRNFQKAAALMAGFTLASGNFILTMDADLQDEPKEIPRFLETIKQNPHLDLVVGWKYKRHDPWHKKIPSRIFNSLVRKLTGIRIHDSDCNFRLMRREVIESIDLYGGLYRYIPSLAHSKGFRVGEIKVTHNPRKFGKSKFGAGRLIKGALDLLTIKFLIDYKKSPLYLFGTIGVVTFGLGFLSGLYLLLLKIITGAAIGQRPLLLLSVLLLIMGIQFLSFGLVAEMIQAGEKRKTPPYQIRTILK